MTLTSATMSSYSPTTKIILTRQQTFWLPWKLSELKSTDSPKMSRTLKTALHTTTMTSMTTITVSLTMTRTSAAMMKRLRDSNIALSRYKKDAEDAKGQATKKGRSSFYTANSSPSQRIWLALVQTFSPAATLNSVMTGSLGFQCTPTTELVGTG